MSKFPQVNIGIKPSKVIPGEVGLFALRPLKKGTIINKSLNGREKFYSKEVYKKLDKITKERVDSFCTGVQKGFFSVPDLNSMPISWYCNHSCEPNAGFDRRDNIVLIKNVKAGDEIVYDYGFAETNPDFVLHCSCGSKNCRKTITGNDWKNPEYVKKNKKYMSI